MLVRYLNGMFSLASVELLPCLTAVNKIVFFYSSPVWMYSVLLESANCFVDIYYLVQYWGALNDYAGQTVEQDMELCGFSCSTAGFFYGGGLLYVEQSAPCLLTVRVKGWICFQLVGRCHRTTRKGGCARLFFVESRNKGGHSGFHW